MKKLLCIFMALIFAASCMMIVSADGIDGPKKVSDVSNASASTTPADWAKEDVEKALELGILDSDKTYYYGSFITREEFCEIIDRFIDSQSLYDISAKHAEVPFDDTENPAVFSLYIHGIINGKGERTFAPNDFLTREEAAVIISRLLKYNSNLKAQSESDYKVGEYDDFKDISSWAIDGVNRMTNLSIMEGYGNKVFYPKASYSVEEAVVMIMRLHKLCEDSPNMFSVYSFADSINSYMSEDENYMFSPLSIKMALALAANGAEGETKTELLEATQINDLDNFNEYSKGLIEKYSGSDRLNLNIANSVWVNTDNSPHDLRSEYKKTVSDYYNAEVGSVNNDNAVKRINGWVNDKTVGRIPNIIDDSDFWSALVNAIYFKGSWQNEFSKSATKPDTFTNGDGTKTETDFMNQTDYFYYSNANGKEIVKLPYKTRFVTEDENGKIISERIDDVSISMYLIKTDFYERVEETLNSVQLESERIKLSVPKFKIEYKDEVTKMLHLETATSRHLADFSGMMKLSPDEDFWIDKVLHKTYISVDEEGTEAAAVTAVVMAGATSSKPKEPILVKFDEPFYFVIRDDTNGEILFMGRYAYAE